MISRRAEARLAACLTALAGYVDAIGFLQSGGTFVSFMSGNSTHVGSKIGSGDFEKLAVTVLVIFVFLGGVVLGHLLRRWARARAQLAVLLLVAALLAAAGLLADTGRLYLPLYCSTCAMGAVNATFEKDGEVSASLTYVSSTVVKIGDHLADALTGGPRWAWVKPFLHWLSFVGGAVAGGFAFSRLQLDAVWIGAAAGLLGAGSVAWASAQPGEEGAQQRG